MADVKNANAPGSGRHGSRAGEADPTEQLLLTLSAATGQIVKIEKLEAGGERHELTDREYVKLAAANETAELDAAIEQAYQVGVEDALGEDDEDWVDDAELALRRLAFARPIVRSVMRREVRRRIVGRVVQGDTPQRAGTPRTGAPRADATGKKSAPAGPRTARSNGSGKARKAPEGGQRSGSSRSRRTDPKK